MDDSLVDYKQLVLGVDPGEVTGWSIVSYENGFEFASGTCSLANMIPWLQDHKKLTDIEVIVIEDFRLLPGKAKSQIGSKFETVQVIGMFKMWAALLGAQVVMQSPSIKTIAEKISGVRPRGSHDKSHHVDAYNHAIYYLKQHDRFTTRLEHELNESYRKW